ncbi:MAG: TolC family protein [Verrucomicrobiae bacterium]|nr:TolC family protein [Verrucomicrobiae bacterium]
MRTFCTVLVAGVTACAGASGQTQLDLAGAIGEAVAKNPELAAARARIEAATGRALQSRAWPNPTLELSSEELPPHRGGFSDAQNMVGVAQTVPFPGKKQLDARIGAQGLTAAEWEYFSRELELVRDVKIAFYRALGAQKKLAVTEQLAELAGSTAAAARKRVEAGAAPDQEQLRAEIEHDRAVAELAIARRDVAEALKTLAALMGRPRDPLGALAGELTAQAQRPDLDQARDQMLARHPNVRAALAHRERAELELRRAKLDPYPDVTFGIAGGHGGYPNEALMAFRISIPLPLLDRSQGRQREARALADIARHDLSATELRLTRDLAVVDERLKAAAEQVETYRTHILPKSEAASRLVRTGYEAGKFGLLDILDTQRTRVEVQLAYYDRLLELNTAQAELEALLAKNLSATPARLRGFNASKLLREEDNPPPKPLGTKEGKR